MTCTDIPWLERTTPGQPPPWQIELKQLLAESFDGGEPLWREGTQVSVQIRREMSEHPSVFALHVALTFLVLSPPQDADEEEADAEAFDAFRTGLDSPDEHEQIAACEALGQLATAAACEALQRALHDPSSYVQAAAARGLAVSKIPRPREDECSNVRLVLWRQGYRRWEFVDCVQTNHLGRAVFPRIPADAVLSLQLLETDQPERLLIPARPSNSAKSAPPTGLRSYSLQMPVHEGTLTCTVVQKPRQLPYIKFHSTAAELAGGALAVHVCNVSTNETVYDKVLPIKKTENTDAPVISVSVFPLELTQTYEVQFVVLAAPTVYRQEGLHEPNVALAAANAHEPLVFSPSEDPRLTVMIEDDSGHTALTVVTEVENLAGATVRFRFGEEKGEVKLKAADPPGAWQGQCHLRQDFKAAPSSIENFYLDEVSVPQETQ